MKKSVYITDESVIIDISKAYCKNAEELLSSRLFSLILSRYVQKIKDNKMSYLHDFLSKINFDEKIIIKTFKMLYILDVEELNDYSDFKVISEHKDMFITFIEDLYDYWRHYQRYAVFQKSSRDKYVSLKNNIEDLTSLILDVYRTIIEKVRREKFGVYRQLPCGVNVGFCLKKNNWPNMNPIYNKLDDILFVNAVSIKPPFIVYSKANKRVGVYEEVFTNPLKNLDLDKNEYMCYPIYVGSALAYVYFHLSLIQHAACLANLFEFANIDAVESNKPELVYVFGANIKTKSVYFHDEIDNIMLGVAPLTPEIDYFGYMKKMLLTLYNVKQIKSSFLPIHGACVNLTLNDGSAKTIVMVGDSGAGKSETLEALKAYAGDKIVKTETIFDDMGTLKFKDGQVYAYGTETGAFVRLDDLENGYAFSQMDRAIITNPDKQNSRIILPAATYKTIMSGYAVDAVLYANNYEEPENKIMTFKTKEEAIKVFKTGCRMAKGTTGEKGLVKSYFANPFGPVQNQEDCDILIDKYFSALFEHHIYVGQMFTMLGISGYEHIGPKQLSVKLFELIKEL